MFFITSRDRSRLIRNVFLRWETLRSLCAFVYDHSRPTRARSNRSHIIVLAERGVVDSTILCQGALAAFRQTQNERG